MYITVWCSYGYHGNTGAERFRIREMGMGREEESGQEVTEQQGFEKLTGSVGGWEHKGNNVCKVMVMCQVFKS